MLGFSQIILTHVLLRAHETIHVIKAGRYFYVWFSLCLGELLLHFAILLLYDFSPKVHICPDARFMGLKVSATQTPSTVWARSRFHQQASKLGRIVETTFQQTGK